LISYRKRSRVFSHHTSSEERKKEEGRRKKEEGRKNNTPWSHREVSYRT
jgi:hypothetical protein